MYVSAFAILLLFAISVLRLGCEPVLLMPIPPPVLGPSPSVPPHESSNRFLESDALTIPVLVTLSGVRHLWNMVLLQIFPRVS